MESCNPLTPDNVKKRMQVKLGRTKSPETLIGTENYINGNEELDSNELTNGGDDQYANGNGNDWNKKIQQMNNYETKNDGRRSISSRVSHYDYAEIYSSALKLNDNMNPEIALDNIQIHSPNHTGEVECPRGNDTEEEPVIDEDIQGGNEQNDTQKASDREDVRISNSAMNIQNRLEEEIKHCLDDKSDLGDQFLENEKRPFSQKSIDYTSGHTSSMNTDFAKDRPLYRENSEEKQEENITVEEEKSVKPSSASLALSRQSRPSSCSLPVSVCSSRMSDVETNDNEAKLSKTKATIPTPENPNDFGSYGDILNVLERIEKETSESEDVIGKSKRNSDQNDSSRSSSRRSSATFFAATPRNNVKTSDGADISGNAFNYDSILNEKPVRSSSKMR